MGYTICPICFPEYVYCDEDCENCKEYIEFKQFKKKGEKQKCVCIVKREKACVIVI